MPRRDCQSQEPALPVHRRVHLRAQPAAGAGIGVLFFAPQPPASRGHRVRLDRRGVQLPLFQVRIAGGRSYPLPNAPLAPAVVPLADGTELAESAGQVNPQDAGLKYEHGRVDEQAVLTWIGLLAQQQVLDLGSLGVGQFVAVPLSHQLVIDGTWRSAAVGCIACVIVLVGLLFAVGHEATVLFSAYGTAR